MFKFGHDSFFKNLAEMWTYHDWSCLIQFRKGARGFSQSCHSNMCQEFWRLDSSVKDVQRPLMEGICSHLQLENLAVDWFRPYSFVKVCFSDSIDNVIDTKDRNLKIIGHELIKLSRNFHFFGWVEKFRRVVVLELYSYSVSIHD